MSSARRMSGWLAIPALLVVLGLTGMALSSEDRQDFEQRTEQERADQERQDQARNQGQNQGQSQNQNQGQDQNGDQGRDPDQNRSQPDQDGRTQSGSGDSEGGGDDGSQRRPVTIATENGEIVIEVNENGQPVRVAPGESFVPSDPDRTLTPDSDGNLVGFRVTDQGLLEPVERDDFGPGDFLLTPSDGGVAVDKPNGDRVLLTPSADGELTGTQVTAGGAEQPLSADGGDITIQAGDDFTITPEVDPATQPLVVETFAGPVRVELQPDGDIVANQPADRPIDIDPDELSAIRVDEDGNLELVPLDEVRPDDTLLVPNGDGFDLTRPDGSRVEFRPDGENDGMTATEITPDGTEIELTPNPDGSVTLSDGTTVGPIDVAEDGGTFEQMVDRASELPWPWVFGAIALLVILSAGTAFYLHRNRPDDPFDYSQFATGGVPEDQFEQFLSVLTADPDYSRAIRLAFYAAERGLGGVPPRRADETPFEWLARVEQRRPELARPLAPICDMFALVRFAPGQAGQADRDLMVEHLRELNEVANRSATAATAGV